MRVSKDRSSARLVLPLDYDAYAASKDITCTLEDGAERWVRGLSTSTYLVAAVSDKILAYVSGCYLKYVKIDLNPPNYEIIRIFRPNLGGINIIEGCPKLSFYALAENCRRPRIFIYQYDKISNIEMLQSELKGSAEHEIRSVKFYKSEILLVLVGVPEFTVCIWKWTTAEELVIVSCLAQSPKSNLLISSAFEDYWIEWSKSCITLYELQAFTENTVIRTEILLPQNTSDMSQPDSRRGQTLAVDILDVVWTDKGDFYFIDTNMILHTVNLAEKMSYRIGPIPLQSDVKILSLHPYEHTFVAATSNGHLQIIRVDSSGSIKIDGHVTLSSALVQLVPSDVDDNKRHMCFYCVTEALNAIDIVTEGKYRGTVTIVDFLYSSVKQICFIEPSAAYIATLSEDGVVTVWNSRNGVYITKWNLPIVATGIESHPLLPFVVCGTDQGTIVIFDVEDIENPKIMHRSYLNDIGVIDRIAFSARGKFLTCGEESSGKIYLLYGFPSLHFMYLDTCQLEGRIWHLNIPNDYKDLRLQILTKGPFDEVPAALYNFRLDKDELELVAYQLLDAPITTMCFSSFKRLSYSYSCEGRGIGFVPFTDDMQAGSLKEPDLQFNFEFPLHISRIQLRGSKFYTFGQDGFIREHAPPLPKHAETITHRSMQTHYYGSGGIVDGKISENGCFAIALGADGTFVVVNLDEPEGKEPLEYGTDYKDVVRAQKKRLAKVQLNSNAALSPEEVTLVEEDKREREEFAKRKYRKETQFVLDGISDIKEEMKKLIAENVTQDEDGKLELDEFELDSDEEEILEKEYVQDKAIVVAKVVSTIEERDSWIKSMKEMVWDSFLVKGSRVTSFSGEMEVSNYALQPRSEEFAKQYRQTRYQRMFDKQVAASEPEISRTGAEASISVFQLMSTTDRDNSVGSTEDMIETQGGSAMLPSAGGPQPTASEMATEEHEISAEASEVPLQTSLVPITVNQKPSGKLNAVVEKVQSVKRIEGASVESSNEAGSKSSQTVVLKAPDGEVKREEDDTHQPQPKLLLTEFTDSPEEDEEDEDEYESSEDSESDIEDEFGLSGSNQSKTKSLYSAVSVPPGASIISTSTSSSNPVQDLRTGSRSYDYVTPNSLMYDQLDVSARHHMNQQMVFIQNEIRRLKEFFNQEFNEVRNLKEAEMQVIADRNERMREIARYFNLNMDIEDPKWTEREDIANAIVVRDDEIKAERYYTEEELEEMEKRRLAEEARRLALQDDFRERALMVMMDGVLEKKQEELLKKDIPKPPFMLLKEEWEWTSDEYRAAEEYHRKVVELEKARENLKKELENEIKTLMKANVESKNAVDARIKQLWELKINIEICIRTEEVKLCRMVKQILQRQIMDIDEQRLSMLSKKVKESIKNSQNLASQLSTLMEYKTKQYDFLSDRDRVLEKTFQRDLGEVGHCYDFFSRLYRKRPKITGANEKSPEFIQAVLAALTTTNLRQYASENGEMEANIAQALVEFDDPIQNPSGCPRTLWDRFVVIRRDKLVCEYELKLAGFEVLGLKKAMEDCRARQSEFESAIGAILNSLSAQRDAKLANIHNFEFQLNLLQGQVELPNILTREDFKNALLMKRNFIETSNHFIKKYGSVKLSAMERNNILHRKIKQWEWRFKHATLTKKNLVEKYNDVNTIKATKEILAFIKEGRNFKKMQEARLKKIKDLQILAEKFHARFMEAQQHLMKAANRKAHTFQDKNIDAEKTIFKQNLQVNEARLMCKLVGTEEQKDHLRRRMEIIIQTGRIMRRISRNAEEIVLLENELDRQYRRTFPVL